MTIETCRPEAHGDIGVPTSQSGASSLNMLGIQERYQKAYVLDIELKEYVNKNYTRLTIAKHSFKA